MKTALISVSDKSGLVPFAQALVNQGVQILSTGGTSRALREAGVPVTEVGEWTGFPEVMDGRVRTLHPRIHCALLARMENPEDRKVMEDMKLPPIDLVVVNLYPFEETLRRQASDEDLIENIDIGGPTLLRAAAKNFDRVTVVCRPQDYPRVLAGEWRSMNFRREMASHVFALTASYDSLISQQFLRQPEPQVWTGAGQLQQTLRYGENPQQRGWWYRQPGQVSGLQSARCLQGKELSYNNILDLEAATKLVARVGSGSAVIVKHNNPCGVGVDKSVDLAVARAIDADPVSAFGGILAIGGSLTLGAVMEIHTRGLFLECIVAPKVAPEALQELGKKKNLRVLEWPELLSAGEGVSARSIRGGWLVQDPDEVKLEGWEWPSRSFSDSIKQDLFLAWQVAASLKSNAICLVEGGQTLGLGMGQVNRVDAVRHALERAERFGTRLQNAVAASDAFFPFPDSIEILAEKGIRWVVQPGGSLRDAEVWERAQQLGVHIVRSGQRHFLH